VHAVLAKLAQDPVDSVREATRWWSPRQTHAA
jgi:hypothetical protein